MDQFTQKILQFASTSKNSADFLQMLRDTFAPIGIDGYLFLDAGIELVGLSYCSLAIDSFKHALTNYFLETGNENGQSACYHNMGIAYFNLGEFKSAKEYHEKALRIDMRIGDEGGQMKCYSSLGAVCCALNDFTRAIRYSRNALELISKLSKKNKSVVPLLTIGRSLDGLGNFKEAIKYYKQVLRITLDFEDRNEKPPIPKSTIYTCLGNAHNEIGEYKQSIKYHEQALETVEVSSAASSRSREAICYINLGEVYENLRDFTQAIWYGEKALRISSQCEDLKTMATAYLNLGVYYDDLGNFQKAIEHYEKALCMIRKNNDRSRESKCLTNLAEAYRSLGCYEKTAGNKEKAKQAFKESIARNVEAIKIAVKIGDRIGEAKSYGNLANTYDNYLGKPELSMKYNNIALKIGKEKNERRVELGCHVNLAREHWELGNRKIALEHSEKALVISRELGDTLTEGIINLITGQIFSGFNDNLAYKCYKRSKELLERIGGKLIEDSYKTTFYAQTYDVFQLLVPICMKLKKEEEMLQYSEESKSRALIDLLANTRIRPTVTLTNKLKTLLDHEEFYLGKYREIQTRYIRRVPKEVDPNQAKIVFRELQRVYDKIEKIDPNYVLNRRPEPLSLKMIQHMLSSFEKDTILVEYFTTEKEVYVFTVSSKENNLNIKKVQISHDELLELVLNFAEEMDNYPDTEKAKFRATWLGLSDYLIKPISEYLTGHSLVCFIPDGFFHYIPLHALLLNDEPLIKTHPVTYSSSSSLLKICLSKGSGKFETCVSFGMDFEEEAKDIAGLFNSRPYVSSSATKAEVRENSDNDVIHFSCHGIFDIQDPLNSGLELFDGRLTAREIFDLQLNTELVTLSACKTGLNKFSRGNDLAGLTRAFLYAGAPSVVVSLWEVEALSTQEMMTEFYIMLRKGHNKAAALQESQKRMMKKYAHPYYWAPFKLVGKI